MTNFFRISTRTRRIAVFSLQALVIFGGLTVKAASPGEPLLTLLDAISVLDFGRQSVGGSAPAESLTFTNDSQTPLTVTRVRLAGVNPADFSVRNDSCTNASLSAGLTCTVTIGFAPTAGGNRSSRLVLETSASATASEMPLAGFGLDAGRAARSVGPVDLRFNFPVWYQDENGLRLAICLDANGLCLGAPPDASKPPSITDSLINFPDEAFWWSAESQITRSIGGNVRLVLAKEAAFVNDAPRVGDQITFDRVRIRIDRLVAGKIYKVTHPYGVISLKADSRGEIDFTEDIGCVASPCDFQKSMTSGITKFLRWDPSVAPLAPTGYIGDPNVPHRVVGSPLGTNYFKIEGTNVGGTNINVIQTSLFNVQGKLY